MTEAQKHLESLRELASKAIAEFSEAAAAYIKTEEGKAFLRENTVTAYLEDGDGNGVATHLHRDGSCGVECVRASIRFDRTSQLPYGAEFDLFSMLVDEFPHPQPKE